MTLRKLFLIATACLSLSPACTPDSDDGTDGAGSTGGDATTAAATTAPGTTAASTTGDATTGESPTTGGTGGPEPVWPGCSEFCTDFLGYLGKCFMSPVPPAQVQMCNDSCNSQGGGAPAVPSKCTECIQNADCSECCITVHCLGAPDDQFKCTPPPAPEDCTNGHAACFWDSDCSGGELCNGEAQRCFDPADASCNAGATPCFWDSDCPESGHCNAATEVCVPD